MIMTRKLGILIPIDCLEDDVIYQFCKPYLEDGTFQELTLTKQTSPPKRKVRLAFTDEPSESIAEKHGLNTDYVKWAKAWHKFFFNRSQTKVLKNADLLEWVKTIRLMIEDDKRDMVKMWQYFKFMETLAKDDKRAFWYVTVDSVSGIRKHWDKISNRFWEMEVKVEDRKAGGF